MRSDLQTLQTSGLKASSITSANCRGSFCAHSMPGYGAFSYSHSHINKVYNYILNQEKHHKKKTFRQEYLELLEKFK